MRQCLFPAVLLTVACAMGVSSLTPVSAADSWAFAPGDDTFAAEAVVDLRSLNEAMAGEKGFITRSPDGNDFAFADGRPVRFWAINSNPKKPEDMAYLARFLAKRGVNLVRVHANCVPDLKKNPKAGVGDANREEIDRAWRWIAALKKEGIYAMITPYWANGTIPESWGIRGQKDQWGVLFANPTFQEGFKSWMKTLYTEANPYTGIPLAEDPSVAIIQIQNEDSLLFWTFKSLLEQKGQPYDDLRKAFGTFAAAKYGDLDKTLAAWGGNSLPGDNIANGMLDLFQPWNMLNPTPGEAGRALAETEFLTRAMHDFNAGMERYLRDDLGCKQLINANNWRPADMVKLLDSERWSYSANQVTAVNRYVSPYHNGPNRGWALEPGDQYLNQTCTLDPQAFPLNCKQPVGSPFIITETQWVMPDLYQSESTLMVAAYSSLTGIDAVFWNGTDDRSWHEPIWPWRKMYKWPIATPTIIGQFPAAALLYRKSYAATGAVAVHEERTLDDLWHQRPPLIAEEAGYDPNRDAGLTAASSVKATVDPLAFLVGRVEVVYDGDPAKNQVADLSPYLNTEKKTVRSLTGEEHLDYGRGLFTLDTPKAQGATGLLGKIGAVNLKDVTITCGNPYAAITVVTLDDQPIATSQRLLIQIGTTCRPTDWKEHATDIELDAKSHRKAAGFVIDSIGKNPWQVENAIGSVTITNSSLKTATALDANLMRAQKVACSADAKTCTITLPANALYIVVEGK